MALNIHQNIKDKLKYFYDIKKIPNIIFNGPSGSGKSTIVNDYITLIYDGNKEKIKEFVMYVNCAHGKGIKFIREELKFFAKTHINSNGGDIFKSIVLLNGDKLTMDAQSALRRCIELFSHNTRFFIIVEDKYKLLKPILSRFCEIYVSEPEHKGLQINLYKYTLEETFKLTNIKNKRMEWLKKELQKYTSQEIQDANASASVTANASASITADEMQLLAVKLYEKAYNALDVIHLIDAGEFVVSSEKKYELLIAFNKVRKEFRNEKLLLMFMFHFLFIDKTAKLENISFM
jgi:DNA polymerase III delta prime subunit